MKFKGVESGEAKMLGCTHAVCEKDFPVSPLNTNMKIPRFECGVTFGKFDYTGKTE